MMLRPLGAIILLATKPEKLIGADNFNQSHEIQIHMIG
jgi:hypothetical protein